MLLGYPAKIVRQSRTPPGGRPRHGGPTLHGPATDFIGIAVSSPPQAYRAMDPKRVQSLLVKAVASAAPVRAGGWNGESGGGTLELRRKPPDLFV